MRLFICANTLLNTTVDQTLQAAVSRFWQNTDVTSEITFHKAASVCLTIQQKRQKGNYRGALLVTKGRVNHEFTLPREHHHLFMRCQTQWVKTGFSRCSKRTFLTVLFSKSFCLCHQAFPILRIPSDFMFFVWPGLLADQGRRRYNRCPAGEVTSQHSVHTVPLRPAWGISQWTTDPAGSHLYVVTGSLISKDIPS